MIDCSGSGDVKMYGPVRADVNEDGFSTVLGKSGRRLKLNSFWSNPSGDWFVGSKVGG